MASKEKLRLDDQLCFALYAATNAVTRAYRPLLAEIDLTYPQYLVMLTLWQEGPLTPGRIATHLELGPNAISPLLTQLEAAGLLQRKPDTVDRRKLCVVPTEAGLALESAAAQAQDAVVCATGLDDQTLADLRSELKALSARLAESPGPEPKSRRNEETG